MRTHEENKGRVWQLLLGGELITEIVQTADDFPWTYGDVTDLEAFNTLRVYFHDPDEWPDTPEFDAVVRHVQQTGLALYDARETTLYTSFILNAEQDSDSTTVWFRNSAVEALDAESDTDTD